ncbi:MULTISPECIES: hypothetical protein [Mycobacterium]|uniref:Uncharacterized protein n=1 Tax=Mycobacterium kiyosense TaxID=2871094 RepID=A0A9P3Q3F3_9MYCO|nr:MULTISPECIES: hypothetical protein [Mycobacterium]BDB44027.1 hypothetical protein IWGMT90018_44730 [Mycobacterium kiyosense]BDE15569.1 hypothetical protein MKCMC460_44290 [Mycobacterium sp. 20KCMC460]GLB81008.1 hypothetical protein SRL2020028_02640 [Mycobacterium kiyosense]GLB87232.1 hypothetical protein SRL2020130_00490 [Mycobacterium kiyosense]GLB93488.1 hypothetical protein SRL2020226_02640 [Mycobacterium kiyosense]
MNAQAAFQRFCAFSGIICVLLFFGGFVAAGFLPPLSPGMSAAQVAAHYRAHTAGIRLGAGLIFLSSMFYIWFTAVISGQIRRIPGVHPTVVNATLAAGAFAGVTFLVPALMFAITAFRPDRSPDATLMLNDMSWIMLVMPWTPFMPQYISFAFAILSDPRPQPLFPRWLAYFNIWVEMMFTPATVLPFFKSGPFAWNGLFVFWLPATVFTALFIVNTTWLIKAINAEAREIPQGAEGREQVHTGVV